MNNKKFFIRSCFKDFDRGQIESYDELNFLNKSEEYLQNKIFIKNEDGYQIKSGVNFITGLRGCGKSSFINFILWNLKNNSNNFLAGRKIIPIFFTPRYFPSNQDIYEAFFGTLVNGLLKVKYDKNIQKESNDLLNILEKTGNDFFKILSGLLSRNSYTIEEKIVQIQKAISETYKDYVIVIVIDEIDRVEKEDLIKIGKVINIIKWTTTLNKGNGNILSFYSADSRHLYGFYFSDKETDAPLNFYQYFEKFGESKYDVYENSKNNITNYIFKRFLNIQEKYDKVITDKEINNDRNRRFYLKLSMLQNDLEKLGIPITMRNIDNIMDEILQLSTNLSKKIEIEVDEKYIDDQRIKIYIGEKLSGGLIFHILYIISIKDKIRDFGPRLEQLENSINKLVRSFVGSGNRKDEIKEKEGSLVNEFYNGTNRDGIKFSYLLDLSLLEEDKDIKDKLLQFIKEDYKYIKEIINDSNFENRKSYIQKRYEIEVASNIMRDEFEINKSNAHFLYSTANHSPQEISLFDREYTHAFNIRRIIKDDRAYKQNKRYKFYHTIIKCLPLLIKKGEKHDRSYIKHIISTVTTLSAEIYHYSSSNNNSVVEIKHIKELIKIIDGFVEDDIMKYIGFWFYSHLYNYSDAEGGSGYGNFEIKMKTHLDKEIDINDIKSFIGAIDNSEQYKGSRYFGIKAVEGLENILQSNKGKTLDKTIGDYLVIYRGESSKADTQLIVGMLFSIIFIIFEKGIIKYDIDTIMQFVNKYISLDYQFLLLCRVLKYNDMPYNDDKVIVVEAGDQKSLLLAKALYKNLYEKSGKDFTDKMVDKLINKLTIQYVYEHVQDHHTIEEILGYLNNPSQDLNRIKSEIKYGFKRYFEENNNL